MKILTKWRNFKNQRIQQKTQGIALPPSSAQRQEEKRPERPRPYQESNGNRVEQIADNNNFPNLSAQLEPYENNSAGESRHQAED